jgi:AbrB family looped-hinge helix DNA binding protein
MHHKTSFYGTTTVGTKGQVVIPAEAREDFDIKPGDKLIVLGLPERKMLGICSAETVEALLGELTDKLKKIRNVIDSAKGAK